MTDRNYWFRASKRGESTRKCCDCGAGFEPRSRNQKRCGACRAENDKMRNRRKVSA